MMQQTVKTRKVFYLPGYDPFPARRYRELYRMEGAKQAQISGYTLSVDRQKCGGGFGWSVITEMDGVQTRSDIEVLHWADLVQSSMSSSILATYLQMVRTAWIYLSTGAFFRLMKLRAGPTLAALYPVFMLSLQLLVAVALGIVFAWGIGAVLDASSLAIMIQLCVFALIFWATLKGFKALDGRLFAYYLMHDYHYSSQCRGANPPSLDVRLKLFEAQIIEELHGRYDEVLIVGHSSGAHLAINVLASVLRQHAELAQEQRLNLLTLGQVVPMLSFLPDAWALRRDLKEMAAQENVFWFDVSAPSDGANFALCDPVCVSGVAPEEKYWPLVVSAAFTETLSPELFQSIKRRYFRLHFQYLCAFDRVRDYDYFRITAGPLTLRERYAGRNPSKSRIETPLSPYTSTAP